MLGRISIGVRLHGWALAGVLALIGVGSVGAAGPASAAGGADCAPEFAGVPQYELDTSWPKLPLPHNWAFGWVSGIFPDAHNHLWVVATPRHGESWSLSGATREPP